MKKIAIIGAGISGLFIANLFKKTSNYQITVYEKSLSINLDEGYGIQLSVNSVKLLNQIGFDKFKNDQKFNPDKITFYSIESSNKICELDISDFHKKSFIADTHNDVLLRSMTGKNILSNLSETTIPFKTLLGILFFTFHFRGYCSLYSRNLLSYF